MPKKKEIEKIDLTKLEGNQPPNYDDPVPYCDIEKLAEKINEIIDYLNGQKRDE